jgi:hypothetical protein
MPTVEADVAFGFGKFDLSLDEVRSRVSNALQSVGMADYSQVGILKSPILSLTPGEHFSLFRLNLRQHVVHGMWYEVTKWSHIS